MFIKTYLFKLENILIYLKLRNVIFFNTNQVFFSCLQCVNKSRANYYCELILIYRYLFDDDDDDDDDEDDDDDDNDDDSVKK